MCFRPNPLLLVDSKTLGTSDDRAAYVCLACSHNAFLLEGFGLIQRWTNEYLDTLRLGILF